MIRQNIIQENGKFYPWWENLVSHINQTYHLNQLIFKDYRDQLLAEYNGKYYVVSKFGEENLNRYVEFPDEQYLMLFFLRWS